VPVAAPPGVLNAYLDGRYRLHVSDETLDEIWEVLTVATVQSRHGLSDDELLEFIVRLLANAELHTVDIALPASLTRDLTDAKFLALAQHANVGYLVTNDRRHLLRLRHFRDTKIVTPSEFLDLLS
jgi:putative PIN family toxin of toxin-antitoxin system